LDLSEHLIHNLAFLKTINFRDKKLNGAMKVIGINFAIFGLVPLEIKAFKNNVLSVQKIMRLVKYLSVDFE
jgi:hypothetical protein